MCYAIFQPEFPEDPRYRVKKDHRVALRAFDLIDAVLDDPYFGRWKTEIPQIPCSQHKVASPHPGTSNRLSREG